jgi:predicted deacylase
VPLLLKAIALAIFVTAAAVGAEVRELGDGTPWSTPVIVIDSDIDGPTVLLIAGMHGDEPAGPLAAEQISGWRLQRGKLIIVPVANARALAAGTRRTPDVDAEHDDLNRQFPTGCEPMTDLACGLWTLATTHKPDVLIDLHEGVDFHAGNSKSVGASVIAAKDPVSQELGNAAAEAINKTISSPDKRFPVIGPPIAGSFARAAATRLGTPALILETSKKKQSATFRARQHRIMVHRILEMLGMATGTPHVLVGTAGNDGDLAVAMYVSGGVSGRGPARIESILADTAGFDVRRISATDIRHGVLDQFDVVLFPGGSGSGQGKALRDQGRDVVRAFIANGGGYVGVCAGAYLAASNYDWSLGILDAKVIDRAHWKRGVGEVDLEWTSAGRTALAHERTHQSIHYANGPLLAPAGDEGIPDFKPLATFAGEINTNEAPAGVMLGSPAIIWGPLAECWTPINSAANRSEKGVSPV